MALSREGFLEAEPPLAFRRPFELSARPKLLGCRMGWQGSKPNQLVDIAVRGEVVKAHAMTQIIAHIQNSPLEEGEFTSQALPLAPGIVAKLVADAKPRRFSTGSLGWFAHRLETITIGGLQVRAAIQFQAVLRGTKPSAGDDFKADSGDAADAECSVAEEVDEHNLTSAPVGRSWSSWCSCRKRKKPDSCDTDVLLEHAGKVRKAIAEDLDSNILGKAQELAKDGIVDLQDAKCLWRLARLNVRGARTLEHVMSTYAFTEAGRVFIASMCAKLAPEAVMCAKLGTEEPPEGGRVSSCAGPGAAGEGFLPVFYNPGNAGFAILADTLKAAQTSLELCIFALSDDRLAGIVLGLHQRGVMVRVIADDDMHKSMSTSDLGAMQEAGIEVRFDRKKFHMHHKFAVIDSKVCLHGSLNWTTGALRNNRENIIITKCGHIVKSFAAEYERLWAAFADGNPIDESLAPNCVRSDDVTVMFFPDQEDHNFAQLVDVVSGATSTLDVAVFTLTVPELVGAMKEAHRRGVRVRVITDDRQAKFACKGAPVRGLRSAGIEVRTDHSPANMHHKFCVVDGQVLCNGSYNWTRQGEDGNYENVVIYHNHKLLAESFSAEFESLWKQFDSHLEL